MPWIARLQHPNPDPPLNRLSDAEFDARLTTLVRRIVEICNAPRPALPEPERLAVTPRVDLSRLPLSGDLLFGRKDEWNQLEQTWDAQDTRVTVYRAHGGMGKSTLVRTWLEHLEEQGWRGADHAFAWSFYSQGTGERVASADLFIREAAAFFGDPTPDTGSPWDKGEWLAALVGAGRNLRVLVDGLEPLQAQEAAVRGELRAPALKQLLLSLCEQEQGLCIITTWEKVVDLAQGAHPERVQHHELSRVSPEAGRALLQARGVKGRDAELEAAVQAVDGQALALRLLGSLVAESGRSVGERGRGRVARASGRRAGGAAGASPGDRGMVAAAGKQPGERPAGGDGPVRPAGAGGGGGGGRQTRDLPVPKGHPGPDDAPAHPGPGG